MHTTALPRKWDYMGQIVPFNQGPDNENGVAKDAENYFYM